MALSYKTRRRLSLLLLVVGLPFYIVAALLIVNLFDRPPFIVELAVYLCLGVVWALPFKAVFRGIGQSDPDQGAADPDEGPDVERKNRRE